MTIFNLADYSEPQRREMALKAGFAVFSNAGPRIMALATNQGANKMNLQDMLSTLNYLKDLCIAENRSPSPEETKIAAGIAQKFDEIGESDKVPEFFNRSQRQPLKPDPQNMGDGGHYRPTMRPLFKGDGDLGGFKSLGEVVYCAVNSRSDPRWQNLEIKAQSAGVFSEGGALVPGGHSPEFLRMILEASTFLKFFRTLEMANATLTVPGPDDANHSVSRAGIEGAWTAEGDPLTVQTIKTRAILLRANKFGILTKGTREYFQDALGGEAFIRDILAKEAAWSLDHALINSGTGAGQPLGIMQASNLVTVNKQTGALAGTFCWEDALAMFSRLTPDAVGAFWVFSPSLKTQVLSMNVGIGTAGQGFFPSLQQATDKLTLLSLPVFWSEHAKLAGQKGDALLVNPAGYIVGMRQAVQLDVSAHAYFSTDEIGIRLTLRIDGQPEQSQVITLADGTSTVSDFVTLQART